MKRTVLLVILRVAKLTGLFALARLLTAGDLRILCYHGAALRDEHHFRPGLFMGKETFAARMALLARQGYPVIGLVIAVAQPLQHELHGDRKSTRLNSSH